MKKTKKALILSLCAVLLVTASVLGTVAYLTSTDEVVNTFTVGNVEITLDETDVDINGDKDSENRVTENSYKLMPGHTYTKDPIIHVDVNSEDCYLFIKVENGIADIEGETTVLQQMTEKDWTPVKGVDNVYVYMQSDKLAVVKGGTAVKVFDNFIVDGKVNNDTLAKYANKTITVTAYAIQADGFADKTASEIWNTAGFAGK